MVRNSSSDSPVPVRSQLGLEPASSEIAQLSAPTETRSPWRSPNAAVPASVPSGTQPSELEQKAPSFRSMWAPRGPR